MEMDEELKRVSERPGGSPNRLKSLLAFHRWIEELKKQENKDERHVEEN